MKIEYATEVHFQYILDNDKHGAQPYDRVNDDTYFPVQVKKSFTVKF